MQRVAVELSRTLAQRSDLEFSQLVLRSAWRWHHVRCMPWLCLTAARLHRLARRRAMDAVLFSSMVTGSLAVLLRPIFRANGIRVAAIAHGRDITLPGVYQRHVVQRALASLDAVIPVSRATGHACIERGMPAVRVRVVPNGVDSGRFALGAGGSDGRLRLVSVGRLVRRKGFKWFVDQVMPLLPERVYYTIAGSGPEAADIEHAVARRNLTGRVRLLGQCSDAALVQLYQESDLLVMPNTPVPGDMEGFGIVMLEAGACGTPTVAAALEGIRDVITPGVNGVLVPSGDATAFAKAVLDYSTGARMRSRTRDHTLRQFSWDRVASRYVDVLHLGTDGD